jgi:hypothetical protein
MAKTTILALAAVLAVALGACTDVGDCPAAAVVVPGGSCSGDSLQCPYTLQSLSPACDGTTVEGGIATSCVCTSGAWVCPDTVSCPGPAAGDDTGGGGDDGGGSSGDDGGGSAGDDGGSSSEAGD